MTPGTFAVACADLDSYRSLNNNAMDARGMFVLLAEHHRDALTAEGTQLELMLSPCLAIETAHNVVGLIRGSEGRNAFVICGHFDGSGMTGTRLYPSAYDNGSGTVALLETARLLAGVDLRSDLYFAAFNGEESGKDGANAFAEAVCGQYEQINLINLDCVGHKDGVLHRVYDNYGVGRPLAEALVSTLGAEGKVCDYISGDHLMFDSFEHVTYVSVSDMGILGSEDAQAAALRELTHLPTDVPENIDCDRIRALAEDVAAVVREDVLYARGASTFREETDARTGLLLSEYGQYMALLAEGQLSRFTDGYVYRVDGEGAWLFTGMQKMILSTGELAEAFAGLTLPEHLGGVPFRFVQVNAVLAGETRADGTGLTTWRGERSAGRLYEIRMKLDGTFFEDDLVDLCGQIEPAHMFAYYYDEEGRGYEITIMKAPREELDEAYEEGADADPALAGMLVEHTVKEEWQVDGYWRVCIPQENGTAIQIAFWQFVDPPALETGWEDALGQTEYLKRRQRYLTLAELVAEVQSLDLASLDAAAAAVVEEHFLD